MIQRRTALLLPSVLAPGKAAAQGGAVDLLLVLAVDASGSIDPDEFSLQREGCAEALTHPAVLSAIGAGSRAAIGVAMVEWGAPGGAETVVGWHHVSGPASANELARAVITAPRSFQSWNAIGDAVDHAAALIATAPWPAREKVIDISGDAPDMRSIRPIEAARRAAAAQGIIVNALAIEGGRPGLTRTYEETVIAGHGAFVMTADSRADFARAVRAKLIREIA
ncbi:DUF1194 domain-containing protein [Roseomonas xinghualingensis]|uniref:DUF1194 domain-containing protein n=1 Tax=Roseomonas xinghualingensis TaxID=2986475 RepID=UPI0021F21701|nr:DUF1194 domain-containing protein [Roseomonas sp. SXEYE001]MCV4209791.1 DUF1194 domain-containing protein [Roseomonas sp. SXEYE001]